MDRDGVEGRVQSNVFTEKGPLFLDVGTAFQIRGNHSEEGKGSETLLQQKPGSKLLSSTAERRKEKKKKEGGVR